MTVLNFCATIIAGTVITLFVVSAENNYIMITENDSWLSPENFSIMIDASLEKSWCSNVYISGDSGAVEAIFTDFVKIYRRSYVVMERNYNCEGYFMISTSTKQLRTVLEIVPMKTSTEVFVIIDDNIGDSSMLFNVSMYQEASTNIVTRNGLWTLTENYLETRVFKKISSPQKMVQKRKIVNLQGRELQAAAFYQPPFCYLQTTVNRTVRGIEGQFFIADSKPSEEDPELDGIEIQLFLLMAERLNFTWMIRRPTNYYRYGRRNGSTWYGGMIGQIYRKEVDIAFTNIWMFYDQYLFANMSHPWTQLGINFLVPRPKQYRSFWALLRPFSLQVWIAILIMLIVQSIYIHAKAKQSSIIPKRFQNYFATLTELMARLLGIWVSARIEGIRPQLQLWHFIGILLVTAYSSNLAASLANATYEPRIDTLQDFFAAKLKWGREEPDPYFAQYFDETDPYGKQFQNLYEREKDGAERHRKILAGNYAIIGRVIGNMFFTESPIIEEDYKNYRVMRDHAGKHFTVFAVQSWLVEPISKVLLRLRESGIAYYHLLDVIHRRTVNGAREVFVEHDVRLGVPRVLKLTPLGAGFSLLVFGLTLSSIVFYLELKSVGAKSFISQVLRWIRKNRKIQCAEKSTRKL